MNLTNIWNQFTIAIKDYPNLDFLVVGFIIGFLIAFISILTYQRLLKKESQVTVLNRQDTSSVENKNEVDSEVSSISNQGKT